MSDRFRALALAAVAPQLPPGLAAEALALAGQINDGGDRVDALAAVAPQLAPDLQQQAWARALAAASQIDDDDDRVQALDALAPQLPPDLAAEALAAAGHIGDEGWRPVAMEAVAPQLAPDLQQQAWAQALAAARWIDDDDDRARALQALGAVVSALCPSSVVRSWQELLPVLVRHPRNRLLSDLQVLMPRLSSAGGRQAVAAVVEAINDVGQWWP